MATGLCRAMLGYVGLCSKNELDNYAEFINNFHPSLKFTWAISDNQLPFLDLLLKPTAQGLTTSIHDKETDSHSYLTYTSSHPVRRKKSVPFRQFLRLKRICSDENDYKIKSKEMASFFLESFNTLTLSPEIQPYDYLTTDNPTEKSSP